jgi:hypothetical protein
MASGSVFFKKIWDRTIGDATDSPMDKKTVHKKHHEDRQMEQFFTWIQSILLWDNIRHTLTAFGVFNITFWMLVWTRRPISIVFFLGFVAHSFKTWKTKIWPEIRGQ